MPRRQQSSRQRDGPGAAGQVANLSYAIVPGDGTVLAGRGLVAACAWDIPAGCGRLLYNLVFLQICRIQQEFGHKMDLFRLSEAH